MKTKIIYNPSTIVMARVVIKLVVLFFALYLKVDLAIVGWMAVVLAGLEALEFAVLGLAGRYPHHQGLIYGWMAALNMLGVVWLLNELELLTTEFHLIVFLTVVVLSFLGGWMGGWMSATVAAAYYLFFVSVEVGWPDALIRIVFLLLVGLASGVISEIGQRAYRYSRVLEEASGYSREAKSLKEEFLLIAHHSLRTPLTELKGAYETLQEPNLPDEDRQKFLRNMGESIRQMDQMVEHILAVVTLEGEKGKMSYEEVDFVGLILHQVNVYRRMGEMKDVKIIAPIPDRPIKMLIDVEKMGVVFAKLLDNAVKYSPAGGQVKVVVRELGTTVVVDITDTGPGIAMQDLKYIFEQGFHRVDLLNAKSGGMGISLYLARLIVEQHAGSLEVRSQVGRGTTLIVTLPKLTGRSFFGNLG